MNGKLKQKISVNGSSMTRNWNSIKEYNFFITRNLTTTKFSFMEALCQGRGLAVKFRKKCGEMRWKRNNFHRVFLTSFCGECGESRWIIYFHRVLSVLTKSNRPHTGSNLWLPAGLPLLSPLGQLSLTSLHFLANLNQIE